jgi:folylpolyglutamate synthase/dihydrofolate synthase
LYHAKVHLYKARTSNFLEFGDILQSVFGGKLYEKLKSIPLLHVAGTKGKGTTCAFAETILRARGFKTGLFTSPSFNSVAERIRINGKPVSDEHFAATAKKLENLDEVKGLRDSDNWFSNLTLLGLQIFVELKVDVIILEVGIGGALCSTSQYPVGAPRVCCVTGLSTNSIRQSVIANHDVFFV